MSAASEQITRGHAANGGPGHRQLLIGGRWVDAADGARFEVLDPSRQDALAHCARAGETEVRMAIEAAVRTCGDAQWWRTGPRERARLLWRIGDLLLEGVDRYALLEARDSGRPLAITRTVDVPLAAQFFQLLASWCDMGYSALPYAAVLGGQASRARIARSTGVSALVQACDHPLLSAAFRLAPLIAAGGTAVLIADGRAPLSALALAELVQRAGVPDGVVNVLVADPSAPEALLERVLSDGGIEQIGYVGDDRIAGRCARIAAQNLVPGTILGAERQAEYVFADANLDEAASGALDALLLTADQGPDMTGVLLVEDRVFDETLARVADLLAALDTGDASDPETQLGPLLSENERQRHENWLERASLTGERRTPDAGGLPQRGYFVRPSLLAATASADPLESALPPNRILPVRPFSRAELAPAHVGARLSGIGLWTGDRALAREFSESSRCRNLRINYQPGRDAQSLAGFYTRYRYSDDRLMSSAASHLKVTTVYADGARH